jgi:hypothetical protein
MIAVGALAAWYRTKDRKGPRAATIPSTTSASASTLLPLNVQVDTG